MRKLWVIGILALFGCRETGVPLSEDCRDITAYLSMEQFEEIKIFILEEGDREIIFNKYLENPHYAFEGFSAYLIPEVGQLNMSCDPALSDFNEIIFQKPTPAYIYYRILAIRKGDMENDKIEFDYLEGMLENKVYVVKYNDGDLDKMEEVILGFITNMKNEIGI